MDTMAWINPLVSPEDTRRPPPKEKDWDTRFAEFDKTHPEVYGLFKYYAEQLLASGRSKGGARAIIERMRWHHSTSSDGEFKLNNMFIPRYARKLAEEDKRFETFFDFREMKTERGT
jgi:nucleoside-diphosphate-sugar epimerase